jgi:carboxypeptidase Taq
MSASKSGDQFARLRELLAEIDDLKVIAAVLQWDQQTQMPRGGAVARADHLVTLRGLIHGKVTSPEIGRLLDELAPYEASLPGDSDDAGIIRVARREYERETCLPPDLVNRMSRAGAEGYQAWLRAREARDFRLFAPALQRVVDLTHEMARAMGAGDSPLETLAALVDRREPGVTLDELEGLFDDLRAGLVPLARELFERQDRNDDGLFRQYFEPGRQLEMARAGVRAIGFDVDTRGRQDISVHAFSTAFSPDDVRITTRPNELNFGRAFFSLMHEAGHGTYMQGIPVRYRRTPLHEGASAGMHESQSRLWQNHVARSLPFWQYFIPVARAMFPSQFAGSSPVDIYRAANVVRPSLVRVDADEVTYDLHIMLRYELERDVLGGSLAVTDLPAAWRDKLVAYLGVEPPDDLLGVLQDIHWTRSFGGAFQGYTLGNVMSAQLFAKAHEEHPDMHDEWRRGDFSSLLRWMRRNVHEHGPKLTPGELLRRATGSELNAGPYLKYLRAKFGEIYGADITVM